MVMIAWYFDEELHECFEYLYEGCGGGRNTFNTRQDCALNCLPADAHHCPFNVRSTGTCRRDRKCPAGSTCSMGQFFGICCDDKNRELWIEETNPKCEEGSSLSMRTAWHGKEPRLGRNCSHKFCPDGYECVQTKHFAHCCSKSSK
ncbi:Kunitz/Bovine pancreatic trypsin inhibitor domain protein [Necator americanus]|uniref:Kunitz/Bovine pancreatic trypsin inhibitor domain protein n=1 Tax=Necator americanus TaxID=51031 RepID=W2T5K8_NECAM|nr:Kunitz/Bovine pancreatic trypsin inhibitor domain protein [Necator americanus]ETN77193.1 Kunitz/Bovine pancreatic trypsin inhibitor domain protein [Necator americanus]